MVTVKVYMQDGRVFKFEVEDGVKAREHAHRIINYGWRNVVNGTMEYYPVHQILKVTFPDPKDELGTKYVGKAVK
ncbi:MAG: hypothetical protein PHX83_11855 [Acidobacteriia bacterium]|nr:hypothetical protein [Terriglobia bacterium]